jgi:hypothetical protein
LILALRVSLSSDAKTRIGENNGNNKNKIQILKAFIILDIFNLSIQNSKTGPFPFGLQP